MGEIEDLVLGWRDRAIRGEVEMKRLREALAEVRSAALAGANAIEPRNVIGRVAGIVDGALNHVPTDNEHHVR